MNPAAPVTSVSSLPEVIVIPRCMGFGSGFAALVHKGRLTVGSAVQIQRREPFLYRPDLDLSLTGISEHVERPSIMIAAAIGLKKRLQCVRRLPMSCEQRRSGRIALAEHKGQMVRIPVGASGGIGN